jgi:hypothetical protein
MYYVESSRILGLRGLQLLFLILFALLSWFKIENHRIFDSILTISEIHIVNAQFPSSRVVLTSSFDSSTVLASLSYPAGLLVGSI